MEITRKRKKQWTNILMDMENVVAVGVGYKVTKGKKTDKLSVIVSVKKKVSENELLGKDVVPKILNDVPTDIIETGNFVAYQDVIRGTSTDRWRPAPGGVSIGHKDITAGTLGCLVEKNGEIFILSNNHVLANSNDATIGDAILQPGPYDGGSSTDQIAVLHDYIPIQFEGVDLPPNCDIASETVKFLNFCARLLGSKVRVKAYRPLEGPNVIDAAIAKPLSNTDVTSEINGIGRPTGSRTPALGDHITKSGRTTGVSSGTIDQVDVTVTVQYGTLKLAIFEDQFISTINSDGGDSGSSILDDDRKIVGLLFAGGDGSTVMSSIDYALEGFGVQVYTG